MTVLHELKNTNIMDQEIAELIIGHEKVAHVQAANPLDHALLILIKSGYTAVPVLDTHYRVQGQISKAQVLDTILGTERIEMDKLHEHTVESVMSEKVPKMNVDDNFGKALTLSINHPFVCIEDDEGAFVGLITRRAILVMVHREFQSD
ncbi:cyclic-di-AMP-binding protein CbpB [Marinococcus sp. PL1-022]|jgi:predicted transcriptional regulator|uniref:cyclic-di-AMP-binding protein CbpB n=2 Tax=Marinococcus TaxID=1370 RepID=UPI0029C4E5BD|nr:cyclic-di-AMP-binding protein CbpB [Marinococcus sp. PL1-022]MDX6152362.1 cyclic-di-AMP-binding protein CbpB [Marinococcus sp. PL1-022]